MRIDPIFVSILFTIIASAGTVYFFLHREMKRLTDDLDDAISLSQSSVQTDITATKEVLAYLKAHNEELRENADRLRAHAQEMHDQTRTRYTGRVVPVRGQ